MNRVKLTRALEYAKTKANYEYHIAYKNRDYSEMGRIKDKRIMISVFREVIGNAKYYDRDMDTYKAFQDRVCTKLVLNGFNPDF